MQEGHILHFENPEQQKEAIDAKKEYGDGDLLFLLRSLKKNAKEMK